MEMAAAQGFMALDLGSFLRTLVWFGLSLDEALGELFVSSNRPPFPDLKIGEDENRTSWNFST